MTSNTIVHGMGKNVIIIQYVQSQGRHQGMHNYAKGEIFDR